MKEVKVVPVSTAVASTAPVTNAAIAASATAVSVDQLFVAVDDDVKNVATDILVGIETSRINWQEGAYKTSNQALYAVLADCLKFCGDLDGKKNKARNEALKQFHAERSYPYSADSSLATRVVRAVFGNINRSRVSTYALVVNAAKAAQIATADMAEWIEEQGGVQEIKLAKSPTYQTRAEKVASGHSLFEAKPELATVRSETLGQMTNSEKTGEECVLLAVQNDDSTFTVKAISYKDGVVKAAFAALYAEDKAAKDKLAKQQKAA